MKLGEIYYLIKTISNINSIIVSIIFKQVTTRKWMQMSSPQPPYLFNFSFKKFFLKFMQNQLISDGLEPVLSHTKFMSSIILYPVFYEYKNVQS